MRNVFFFLTLFSIQLVHAQNPEKALDQLFKSYPQEKVVLSFSKPEYLAGETIYFKAYALTGYEPSEISTNLYTELYDKNKNLLAKQIIPLLKGSGDGSFTLPASLAEDVYYIRAYTHWMLNFDEAFQCIRPVHVYNPYSAQSLRPKPVQWTAQAFPESGTLLEGIANDVAVRLVAQGSLPNSWTGKLIETNTKETITDVTVYNSEIGHIFFIPQPGKAYSLQLKDDAGNAQEVLLPKALSTGVAMQAVINTDKLNYALIFKGLASAGKGYRLIGTINDQLAFMATVARSNAEISGSIDVTNFPAGVLHLTLFDEKNVPVAERLCFLHQKAISAVLPQVSTDTISFAPKGWNHWQMTCDSLNWETYDVQVSDASFEIKNDFLSSVYLTSDFLKPIHNAEWYFENVSENKIAALNALLLTEKWNRFQWNDIMQNHFPSIRYRPDLYLTYVGTARKGKKVQALREMNLILQAPNSSMNFIQVKTDSAGHFVLPNVVFVDTLNVFYQPNKKKFMEGDVEIDFESKNQFYPLQAALPQAEWTVNTRSKNDPLPLLVQKAMAQKNDEQLLTEKAKMMQEVVITTKAKSPTEELDKKLSSGLFSGGDATIFDFVHPDQASAMGYNNILEWLQGRIPSFTLVYRDGVPVPQIRGHAAQVFINEMNVDYEQVNSLSVSDIAMVKVFRGNFIGSMGGASAIAIYLRTGDMPSGYKVASLPSNFLVGYKKLTPFFSPDYAQGFNKEAKDDRVILFRNSLLRPDSSTLKVPIEFYNNDTAKKYRLRVTGFTKEGQLVYLNTIVE